MNTPTPPPIEEVRDLLGRFDQALEQVQAQRAGTARPEAGDVSAEVETAV